MKELRVDFEGEVKYDEKWYDVHADYEWVMDDYGNKVVELENYKVYDKEGNEAFPPNAFVKLTMEEVIARTIEDYESGDF